MDFVIGVGVQIGLAYLLFASFVCLLAATELKWPRGRLLSYGDRARAIGFSAAFAASSILSVALFHVAMRTMDVRPYIGGRGVLWIILAAFLGDFFYYWYHRAQHSVAWLWRFHSIHHAAEELGAGAGYHHLLEGPCKALFVSLPTALFVAGGDIPEMAFLIAIHGYYIHSTTRLNFGRFAWVIADNRTHRIHHSLEPEHRDRNFGALTMIWDAMFGTARFPEAGEWPNVGLDHQREPRSLLQYLALSGSPVHQVSAAQLIP